MHVDEQEPPITSGESCSSPSPISTPIINSNVSSDVAIVPSENSAAKDANLAKSSSNKRNASVAFGEDVEPSPIDNSDEIQSLRRLARDLAYKFRNNIFI